ncbi:MAG TPA: hypothetical protein VFC01_11485 [Mycobacterium sp.]|nr:hypothetical protein [Mycobacterium sp.]
MWVSVDMAFKLTYTDGQESDYDDDTKWEVDGGVLKLGRGDSDWSVLVSPGHWATIELGKSGKKKDDKAKDKGKDEDKDEDEKAAKNEKADKDEKDDKDDKDDGDDS